MEIILDNISKKYNDSFAVKNLNLKIEDGSLVSLLGPSGCGKSTTLSMIAGLENPSSGNIYFGDKVVNSISSENRDIGMVFQDYALYPHMSILENICFPLKMRKIKKAERIKKATKIAEMMKLENLLHRKPSKLSGGQQQRASIARALVKEPKILLLDEPLSNLDARLRIELRDEIKKIQKSLGITTIFVTHDQEEALSISDKIILLNKGEVQQYSTPREIYLTPLNSFTASFLGNPPINFVNGELVNKQLFLKVNNSSFPIYPKVSNIKCTSSNNVKIGIRPEDISISNEKYDLSGCVYSIQSCGREVYLKIKIHDIYLTTCTNLENEYSLGSIVNLKINRVHVF